MTRWRGALVAALALAACSERPDIQACEQFAEEGYGFPSNRHGSETKTLDVPMSASELEHEIGLDRSAEVNRLQAEIWEFAEREGKSLALRLVTISYAPEAQPPSPLPPICAFVLINGKLEPRERLLTLANGSASRLRLRQAGELTDAATRRKIAHVAQHAWGRRAHYDCCATP